MAFLKIVLIVTAAIVAAVPLPRPTVEQVFSRTVYPAVQPRLTSLSNTVPFALFDGVVLFVAAIVIAMWIRRVRGPRRHEDPRPRRHEDPGPRRHEDPGPRRHEDTKRQRWGRRARLGLALISDTAVIGAVLYFWFLASWGLNYQRLPLGARLDFREERITQDALVALAHRTVDALNRLHTPAHAAGWRDPAETSSVLEPAFAAVQRDLALRWTVQSARPKRTLLSFYFARVSIDGMTDPFFLETLTNDTLLPFEFPATIAHEWGHLAGYADESEASFVGWLICLRGIPPVQYSGWLSLYGTVAGALPRSVREEVMQRLDPGPREDLRAVADRIRRHAVPMASRAGYAVYDRFLKANRVESGVNSYGEVLRLVLGTRFTEDGAPILLNDPAIN